MHLHLQVMDMRNVPELVVGSLPGSPHRHDAENPQFVDVQLDDVEPRSSASTPPLKVAPEPVYAGVEKPMEKPSTYELVLCLLPPPALQPVESTTWGVKEI